MWISDEYTNLSAHPWVYYLSIYGLGYYKKWLASAKISVLSLASNSTINSELARGEWQAIKCSKWGLFEQLGSRSAQFVLSVSRSEDTRSSLVSSGLMPIWVRASIIHAQY